MTLVKNSTAFGTATEFLEESGRKTPAFGIDLGTTNSCIAVVQAGNTPKIIPLDSGSSRRSNTMPSCVMWKGKPGQFVVGREAYNNRYKASTVYSVKRLMGTDETVELHYGTKSLVMTPAEVSAEILKELVRQASYEYKTIVDVVITVPAYFNTKAVKDTVEAGRLAGLNVLEVLREPTSASLIYESEMVAGQDENVLVYDLGGGTFDVSALRISKKSQDDSAGSEFEDLYGIKDESSYEAVYTVLCTDGNSRLGGDDVDLEMYKICEKRIAEAGYDPSLIPNQEKEKLLLRLDRVKRSGPSTYDIPLDFKLKGGQKLKMNLSVGYEDFANAMRQVYNRTKPLVNSVIHNSGNISFSSIVLVGGSTKSPFIKEFLSKDFPGVKLNDALDPDQAVALGASIKAKEAKFHDRNVEIFDVIPLSIGVLSSGTMKPLIKQNQRVPFSVTETFTTAVDNQEEIEIVVLQGNSFIPAECLKLGVLPIKGIPKGKAGEIFVDVTLSVDSNSLLKCGATIGNIRKEIELVNLSGPSKPQALSAKDKRIFRWTKFAESLASAEDRVELKRLISLFSEGEIGQDLIVEFIDKHSKFDAVTKPSIDEDTTKLFSDEDGHPEASKKMVRTSAKK